MLMANGIPVSPLYKGCLQSLWTHFITPSWNFVQVLWQSLLQSTSLGKWCTSYNTAKLLENMLQTINHFKISCLGAPFSWLEEPRNFMKQDLNWILCSAWKKWISGTPLERPPYSPCLATKMVCIDPCHELKTSSHICAIFPLEDCLIHLIIGGFWDRLSVIPWWPQPARWTTWTVCCHCGVYHW
jgi:hypothetical protein